MERVIIEFETKELKDEFMGWLSDGGGEDSFNLVEDVGVFEFEGEGKMIVRKFPND